MARITTKIGDIFSAQIDDKSKKYFQYISNDLTQLNSDVIRVFKTSYPKNVTPPLPDIVNDEVDFYAHSIISLGIKLGFWEKFGNINDVGDLNAIKFRDTDDYGCKINEKPIKISKKWYVWNINNDFKKVGELRGENRNAEIGVVIAPDSIIYRMLHGEYDFVYPGFE